MSPVARIIPLLCLAGVSCTAPCADLAAARLTPAEFAGVAVQQAAGTSGVAGIRTRVLAGDPSAAGIYTILLEVPPHTRIEAHTHRDDRVATVIGGTWSFGYGERFDAAALKALVPGSFYTEPGGKAHFARTGDTAVTVMITGSGPTDTHYAEAAEAKGR